MTTTATGTPSLERFTGCLLAGALGDALGWPVEFDTMEGIRQKFGSNGVVGPTANGTGLFEITDDTQMTLFTAEGCLQAWAVTRLTGLLPDFPAHLLTAYHRWLHTQDDGDLSEGGWLLGQRALHARRAPGCTCISALCDTRIGTVKQPINDRKGCGAIMRAAPAGLLASSIVEGDPRQVARFAFELGCQAGALTHGHPSGFLPAGVLASLVSAICRGMDLEAALQTAVALLETKQGCDETLSAINRAVALARDTGTPPSPLAIESLGGGWVGEEALAIALYCALAKPDDVVEALLLSVNHSGDSDSTGSITGNILGALHGEGALPPAWLERLELGEVIRRMGHDLFIAFEETDEWRSRYLP